MPPSLLRAGENNLGEFNYFLDRRFLVTWRLQVLSMHRGTDDKSIDPESGCTARVTNTFLAMRW